MARLSPQISTVGAATPCRLRSSSITSARSPWFRSPAVVLTPEKSSVPTVTTCCSIGTSQPPLIASSTPYS